MDNKRVNIKNEGTYVSHDVINDINVHPEPAAINLAAAADHWCGNPPMLFCMAVCFGSMLSCCASHCFDCFIVDYSAGLKDPS